MITQVLDSLIEYKIPENDEFIRVAKGKYEYPNTFRKLFKKLKEKYGR